MSEQFVLKWHYQEMTFMKNLSTFLDSDVLTDVTFSVESENIKAHRLVLAMCSVYFFQLFQEMDSQHPVIVLHNAAISDLKAILSFIYRGQCIVSKEQLPSLLSLAKLLKIQGLCDMKVPESERKDEIAKKTHQHAPIDAETPLNNAVYNKPPEGGALVDFPRNDEEDNHETIIKKPPKDLSETCKCFLCGKYLSNQYNLRVHMETHEEAYHACQCCPHVSRSRDALRKHVSYRHPEEYHTRKRKKLLER